MKILLVDGDIESRIKKDLEAMLNRMIRGMHSIEVNTPSYNRLRRAIHSIRAAIYDLH